MPDEPTGTSAQRTHKRAPKTLTPEIVVAAMSANAGIQAHAAADLNVNRSTICMFIKTHPEIHEALAAIEEETNDIAESELLKAIKAGDISAIRFRLERKARNRGYGRNVEVSGPAGGPIALKTSIDLTGLTDEQLDALERAATALASGLGAAGEPPKSVPGNNPA